MSLDLISRDECIYTSCYCEENIYQLCRLIKSKNPSLLAECRVVFISNSHRQIPLWKQKAGDLDKDGLVIWDYHVILVLFVKDELLVYDFDTTLNFPCPFEEYVHNAIRTDDDMIEKYHRQFRIVNSEYFLSNFASDRSHMKNEDGSFIMPPPSYPCIKSPISDNNLDLYISMKDDNDLYGRVINVIEFCNKNLK